MATYQISEYGRIKSDAEVRSTIRDNEIVVPSKTFDNLWSFILEHQSDVSQGDKAFDLFTRGGKRIIGAKNHVGVIETKNKDIVEVLPKIFGINTKEDSKRIFLKMLAVLKNFKNLSFQDASLQSKKDFPILELFITNYINEVEILLLRGIKKGYSQKENNLPFLKGKLEFKNHLRLNLINKSKFFVKYSEYEQNVPLNRIIKSTMFLLLGLSRVSSSKRRISGLLHLLADIPFSSTIPADLLAIANTNRLISDYSKIVKWSEIFLLNKGFTNFSGKTVNQAMLFPMEKVFESFVAHQIKKHSSNYNVSTQHQEFHLVEKYGDKPKFKLKPDIFAKNKVGNSSVIIDTKWKIIDQSSKSKRIKQSDMYQLYAYGRKYLKGYGEPVLYLIYPMNDKFKNELSPFYYEEEKGAFWLKLHARPFDLTGNYKDQVHALLNDFTLFQEPHETAYRIAAEPTVPYGKSD